MKTIIAILTMVFLSGCQPEPHPRPIKGTPINGEVSGFAVFCRREPDSVLCEQPDPKDHQDG